MSNDILRIKTMFKMLRATFPELDKLSDVISRSSFITRNVKPTSLYVHQRSTTFPAHVKKIFNDRHLLFVQWLLDNLSYCRGQRQLNLIANADYTLHHSPYLSGLYALPLHIFCDDATYIAPVAI